jgi:hypothetical protein
MTSHTGRLYTLALALVVFFLAWAVVAARPWGRAAAPDPRLQALSVRAAQLRREAALVNRLVAARSHRSAPAPAVRVVDLPPVTVTRTS